MSTAPRPRWVPSSIRTRFLLVVFLGAVVPLGLIGVWLTRSVVRAGEELLRSELDGSLEKVAGVIERRWSYRHGDLALLAANDVAQRLLAPATAQPLAAADSAYLADIFASLSQTIPSFEYRDPRGVVRWSSPRAPLDLVAEQAQRAGFMAPGSTLTIQLPVTASAGAVPIGTMVARLSIAGLIPTDTALRLPNGAELQIVQRDSRVALLPAFAPDSLLGRDRFAIDGVDWLAVHRSLVEPAIDLFLAAPLGTYVQPFERAARTGALTLAMVSLFVLLFTAFLTTRLTGSLERLATAADAVAGGDLGHRVDASGNDETGRVGAAFNSMVDNLRRTLDELSKRQALAAVGEYAALLSHQVRNGLTAVRVDLQRAEEKADTASPTRPLIARALENVKRLDGTVSASLRVGRDTKSRRHRIDLLPILQAAAKGAEGAFSERGASTKAVTSRDKAAWVLGDPVALEQLFLNLLLNAAQALGRDGHAQVRVDADGADVLVAVTDTGSGIPPENLALVADPFFSTKPDGTGLGLPIARQIAAAHGGSLRIESVVGEGTRVEVRLPAAAAPGG